MTWILKTLTVSTVRRSFARDSCLKNYSNWRDSLYFRLIEPFCFRITACFTFVKLACVVSFVVTAGERSMKIIRECFYWILRTFIHYGYVENVAHVAPYCLFVVVWLRQNQISYTDFTGLLRCKTKRNLYLMSFTAANREIHSQNLRFGEWNHPKRYASSQIDRFTAIPFSINVHRRAQKKKKKNRVDRKKTNPKQRDWDWTEREITRWRWSYRTWRRGNGGGTGLWKLSIIE